MRNDSLSIFIPFFFSISGVCLSFRLSFFCADYIKEPIDRIGRLDGGYGGFIVWNRYGGVR